MTRATLGALASLLAAAGCLASPARAADRVYWANTDATKISFVNLNGGAGGDLSTGTATVSMPSGVALDPAAGRIYWANQGAPSVPASISFANLDGSGGGDVSTGAATVNTPAGVATDTAAGRIYWANFDNTISFANVDGSGGGNLSTSGATVNNPRGVAIHPAAGKIYWSNAAGAKISFANLDGSGGGGDLNTTGATVNNPRGVAVDPVVGRIYWANSGGGGKISYANLAGSGGGADLNTTGAIVDLPRGVAVDAVAGRIYWANQGASNKISFANLSGSGGADLSITGATVSGPNFPSLLEGPSGAGAPGITGGSAPGSVLACSQGSYAADLIGAFLYRAPQRFAYQWSLDGATIAGASASSYTPTATGEHRCTVTGSNEVGSSSQTSAPHAVLIADVSQYAINPRSFLAAGSGPSAIASKRKKRKRPGAKVAFSLNEAASVSFKVKQRRRGRRLVTLRGGFTRAGTAGENSFRFTGRLRGRKLKPGRYLLVAIPTADGKSGQARSKSFRIKRPPRR